MPMTSREVVRETVLFGRPDRIPYDLAPQYGTDFAGVGQNPSTEERPATGRDAWGTLWENSGVSVCGQAKEFPLKTWDDFASLKIPDICDPKRWAHLPEAREKAGDRFLLGGGIPLYARVHYLRGLENTWTDVLDEPGQLGCLVDILVDMNLHCIERYAAAGADGYFFCDDWGLQNRLMISPDSWREIWKPRYARVFGACHDAGLLVFMHSCGYIVDILDDLIEVGLNVIQQDQQQNMGLDVLGRRFGGRVAFWCPVDIQNMMVHGAPDEIRAYCRDMVRLLGRPNGGFIAKWYSDSRGAGHRPEAVEAMCEEFISLSREFAAGAGAKDV